MGIYRTVLNTRYQVVVLYSYIFLTTLDDTLNYNTMHHFLVPMTERIPDHPDELPASLSAALEGCDYACLTIATESGTALLLKAPRIEIESVRGRVPIQLGHELYDHPNAPVIRMALRRPRHMIGNTYLQ